MKLSEDLKVKRAKYDFFDGIVLVAVLILSAIGVLMVFSITGTSIFNNRTGDRLSYMIHSATGVIVGVMAMAVMAMIPNKLFRGKLGFFALFGTIAILIITPMFGLDVASSPGVYRWLEIPGIGIRFQAVDLARIGFTLSLPWLIQRLIDQQLYYTKKIGSSYWIPLAYILLCTVLIRLQPDLGSLIVIFLTGMIVFFSSGIHIKQIIFLFLLVAIAVATIAILGPSVLGLDPYQMTRIQMWLDPFTHPYGLQSRMGFVSIALGGWWGVGLGGSTQALGFAIEPHTDLIVSILSEELGLITVIGVMFLYLLIACKCFFTALKARDVFSALVCIGIGSFFLTQPFVNLGGVSGIIPLSGVTLPLISFGMTSKISTFILIGIYFNMRRYILIDVERNKERKEQRDDTNVLEFPSV